MIGCVGSGQLVQPGASLHTGSDLRYSSPNRQPLLPLVGNSEGQEVPQRSGNKAPIILAPTPCKPIHELSRREVPFRCDGCSHRMATAMAMAPREVCFPCRGCDRSFTTSAGLDQHYRDAHLRCTNCGKFFATQAARDTLSGNRGDGGFCVMRSREPQASVVSHVNASGGGREFTAIRSSHKLANAVTGPGLRSGYGTTTNAKWSTVWWSSSTEVRMTQRAVEHTHKNGSFYRTCVETTTCSSLS